MLRYVECPSLKRRRWSTTPLLVAAYTYLFSACFSSASFGIELGHMRIKHPEQVSDLIHIPWPKGWIPILYAALVASTLAYSGLSWYGHSNCTQNLDTLQLMCHLM